MSAMTEERKKQILRRLYDMSREYMDDYIDPKAPGYALVEHLLIIEDIKALLSGPPAPGTLQPGQGGANVGDELAEKEGRKVFCEADIEDIIAQIELPVAGDLAWDAGWKTGVDRILSKFGIKVWDNFGKINQDALDRLRAMTKTPAQELAAKDEEMIGTICHLIGYYQESSRGRGVLSDINLKGLPAQLRARLEKK